MKKSLIALATVLTISSAFAFPGNKEEKMDRDPKMMHSYNHQKVDDNSRVEHAFKHKRVDHDSKMEHALTVGNAKAISGNNADDKTVRQYKNHSHKGKAKWNDI